MKEIDRDGLLLCGIQGEIFERSAEAYPTGSAVFIRRFMRSRLAERMDSPGFLDRPFEICEAFEELDDEYGETDYGKDIYAGEELYWIGYIYRYWAYCGGVSSKWVYKMISSREMRSLYYPYHTMDPLFAIERIAEAKLITTNGSYLQLGVEMMRKRKAANKRRK